jgi:hypothetical protein
MKTGLTVFFALSACFFLWAGGADIWEPHTPKMITIMFQLMGAYMVAVAIIAFATIRNNNV